MLISHIDYSIRVFYLYNYYQIIPNLCQLGLKWADIPEDLKIIIRKQFNTLVSIYNQFDLSNTFYAFVTMKGIKYIYGLYIDIQK